MTREMDLVRRLYAPSAESLLSHIPEMGESLNSAALDLARDCTLKRVDLMLARIKGAEASLVHLRKLLLQENNYV